MEGNASIDTDAPSSNHLPITSAKEVARGGAGGIGSDDGEFFTRRDERVHTKSDSISAQGLFQRRPPKR
jgi:hypothetical protein